MERRRDRREDWFGEGLFHHSPEPPFTTMADGIVYVNCRCDPDAVRPYVPSQLELADPCDAQLIFYESGLSWGLGPFTRTAFCVEVAGFDSPDGSKAVFMVAHLISASVRPVVEKLYGQADAGETHVERTGDAVRVTAGSSGGTWIDLAMRVTGPLTPNSSGIDRYIGLRDGGLVQHDVAYAATAQECEVEHLAISPAAPPNFRASRPTAIHFAGVNPTLAGTFSVPWPLTTTGDDQTLRSFLDLMAADGRAAAVVSAHGGLLRANDKAMRMLGQVRHSELAAVLSAGPISGPPGQLRRKLGPPLLVRTTPFRLPGTIDDLVLVLLIDLADPDRRAATPFLHLLGLTAAEATIAELVGSGLSARDAATALRLSENTVRSTLKAIYDKLGVAKQSELARLLARLQF